MASARRELISCSRSCPCTLRRLLFGLVAPSLRGAAEFLSILLVASYATEPLHEAFGGHVVILEGVGDDIGDDTGPGEGAGDAAGDG